MSVQAGTVVTIVRDLIPDPVYNQAGVALPGTDGGLFRAQTLFRWLNDGVKALAQQLGWVVDDWTAQAVTANLPTYSLPSQWHEIGEVHQNGFPLVLAPESITLSPALVSGKQAGFYTLHNLTDHFEFGLFPVPNANDPATTLNMGGGLSSVATSMTVTSAAGFLPYGYVLSGTEIIRYGAISGNVLSPLTRGIGGTPPQGHVNGDAVTHCSTWIKGKRMPAEIATGTDPVELPQGFIYVVQQYMLAMSDYAQNDDATGDKRMAAFNAMAARIYADPNWRSDSQGTQVRPYGRGMMGRLAWGNVYVP
jgi:hypothetical protein